MVGFATDELNPCDAGLNDGAEEVDRLSINNILLYR
jgi:hypothetical protein